MEYEDEVIITPLGTVSPSCQGDKNCPGFLIEYKGYKVLLDCGEGISRYLDFPSCLKNLKIVLSHLHKDHYSGLSSIAYESYIHKNFGYIDNKIDVYVPSGDIIAKQEFVDSGTHEPGYYRTIYSPSADFEYLMNYGEENHLNFLTYNEKDIIKHGEITLTFRENPHNLKTYSTKIEVAGLSIVYSGDTGYKHNTLETFSKNADLLICESTFLRGQYKKNDNHLYAYEAAKIAKKANVGKLLLTHFYPTIDKNLYVNEAKEIFENTESAVECKKLILRRK